MTYKLFAIVILSASCPAIDSLRLERSFSYARGGISVTTRNRLINPSRLYVRSVPTDLSFDDTYISQQDMFLQPQILPNTDIHTLDNGLYLGVILWTFVLYYGLFGTAGSPNEWVLEPLARITGQVWKPWFVDYKQGFIYQTPVLIDIIRLLLFVGLAYFCNQAVLAIFEGDSYWCWAIAGSLSIPTGLVAVSRDVKPTREYSAIESMIQQDFKEFADLRLVRAKNRTCDEEKIIDIFQRQWEDQRRLRREQDTAASDEGGIFKEGEGFQLLLEKNKVSIFFRGPSEWIS